MNKELLNIQLSSLEPSPYPDRKKGLFFIHDFDFNGNGLKIPEELASEYLDSLNGSPIVAYYDEFMDDIAGHEEERDAKGNIIALHTDACGFLYNAHIGTHEINGEECRGVWSEGFLWNRFENTMNVIEGIYEENGSVDVSVEVSLGNVEYEDDNSNKRTAKDYINYFGLALLSSRFSPAYKDAGMYALNNLEVASAYKKDIEKKLNSLNVNNKATNTIVGGAKMLSHEEIRDQLRVLLNPNDNEAGGWVMDYATWDMFVYDDFAVARKYDDGKYYRFEYQVKDGTTVELVGEGKEVVKIVEFKEVATGDNVEIADEEWFNKTKELFSLVKEKETEINSVSEEKVKIEEKLQQKETELNNIIQEKDSLISEKETEISSLVEEKTNLETKIKELSTGDSEVPNLQAKIEELQKEINQKEEALNSTKSEANDKIIKLGENLKELQTKLEELQPVKEQYEQLQAEKQAQEIATKQEEMKQFAINSKVIEKKELEENEDIKTMIENCEMDKLKAFIADRFVEQATLETNSQEGDVVVNAQKDEDILPKNLRDEMYSPIGR